MNRIFINEPIYINDNKILDNSFGKTKIGKLVKFPHNQTFLFEEFDHIFCLPAKYKIIRIFPEDRALVLEKRLVYLKPITKLLQTHELCYYIKIFFNGKVYWTLEQNIIIID